MNLRKKKRKSLKRRIAYARIKERLFFSRWERDIKEY